MIWIVLSYLLSYLTMAAAVWLPSFHGQVWENSPVGSRVIGLNVPVRLLSGPQRCPHSLLRFTLSGDGSQDFRAFSRRSRRHLHVATRMVLDREARSDYLLLLVSCCQSCSPRSARSEVARLSISVLDTNDQRPRFLGSDTLHIRVPESAPLRTVLCRLQATDQDSGHNAELTYTSIPHNGSFYVVPKTGEVVLVASLFGQSSQISFSVFATDHGSPSLTGDPLLVTVWPQPWAPAVRARSGRVPRGHTDRSTAPRTLLSLSVSEDASIGSVLTTIGPGRFQSASYQLLHPVLDEAPVAVGPDTGAVTVIRRLDREKDSSMELTVRIQDKQGAWIGPTGSTI